MIDQVEESFALLRECQRDCRDALFEDVRSLVFTALEVDLHAIPRVELLLDFRLFDEALDLLEIFTRQRARLAFFVVRHDRIRCIRTEQRADLVHRVFDDARMRFDLPRLACRFAVLVEHFSEIPTRKNLLTQVVDVLALRAHHVVVLEQVFADVEVAFFDFLLRVFDALCDPWMFDGFIVRHAHLFHQVLHAIAGEDAHQVIFERQEEAGQTRIALTTCTTTKLIVDAP